MTIVDANILLHAYNSTSREHPACRRWLEEALSGQEPVLLPWVAVLAFLRIGTNPRVFAMPLSMAEACRIVDSWLSRPMVKLVSPGERHWEILSGCLIESQAKGALAMDAHLAALARENGAVLCTTDRDFSRFEGLKLLNPASGKPS